MTDQILILNRHPSLQALLMRTCIGCWALAGLQPLAYATERPVAEVSQASSNSGSSAEPGSDTRANAPSTPDLTPAPPTPASSADASQASSPEAASATAAEPNSLHEKIDLWIEARLVKQQAQAAQRSSDAEFVRRIYLDLHGMIPTADQVRRFLADTAPHKRELLIDTLLQQPDYSLHMARVFDVYLLERRIPTISSYDIPAAAWRGYLTEAFAENRPWDRLVREILGHDGTEASQAAGVKFYLVRDVAPHQLTRDIGRLFLGIDLQCAQCHDDPRFESYKQADYFGLYAFLQRVSSFRDTKKNISVISETATGKTQFVSVFTTQRGETSPKLPAGEMIADPMLEADKQYVTAPSPQTRGVPTYSRRQKLAELLPRAETAGFARNLANRLWAQLLGRGLVHPLDLHHDNNPPSHPELLADLTEFLIRSQFDIRALMREIVLSETYQRASVLPADGKVPPAELFAVAPLRGLTPEQLSWSVLHTVGRVPQAVEPLSPPNTGNAAATMPLATETSADTKPANETTAGATAVEPAWKVRLKQIEPLERQIRTWVSVFAGLPGQTDDAFQPTVDHALHFLNSPVVPSLLQDAPSTLLVRLQEQPDAARVADELYLSLLSRPPSCDEVHEVRQLIDSTTHPAERREALVSLTWGLLLTAEFRLNH